ncbi:MAG TPA: FMN-binding negative transcriptional regulator, partial [Planctomycetaceae bacterium]|nr:FMN-binding negative transcriptional regulator [Planctomycetaceae bacterium]
GLQESEVELRMYVPPAFAEDDPATLHRFIEQNSFGILVSQEEDRPTASHLPFLVDWEFGSRGRLIGHMARANPQWIDINRIQGKWKLGQNHPVGRRRLAAQALRQHDDDNSQAIAAAMETTFANEVDQRE